MSASSSRARLLTAAALTAFLAASLSTAQETAPAPAQGPVSILPQNLTTPADVPPEADEAPIAVGALEAPSIDRVGLVDVSKGGFPSDLWTGSDQDTLKILLPQLPRRMNSPAQRRMAENFLLSPGVPPAATAETVANAGEGSPPASAPWLLETRVRALAALGDWDDALALLELVPADQMTEPLKRLRADGHLATDRISIACGEAQAAVKTSGESYWQKIQVFCQLAADQASAAGLGLGVLREQRLDDPAFFWLADLMQGGRPVAPQNLTVLEPLHIAMVRRASGAIPESLLSSTDAMTLGAIAALPLAEPDPAAKIPPNVKRERQRLAIEARMLLAEQAVAAGTLKPEVLRTLYRRWDSKLDPNPPTLTKATAGDVRSRALLFQSASVQTIPTARAEVIARAINLSREDRGETGPDLTVVGQVYAELLGDTAPGADLIWFAGDAARALLAAGAPEKAKIWLDLARNMARTSSDAAIVADGLWPIERLMNGNTRMRFPSRSLQAWAATLPEANAARQRERALTLLTAVGEQVTAADWLPVMEQVPQAQSQPVVAPLLWNGLVGAARARRIGEAAMFSLLALGQEGPGHVSFATIQKVVETLAAVGREQDARMLAVEAALVQGL